ncbi:catalase-related domain-containing protein [Pantoea ananatis]
MFWNSQTDIEQQHIIAAYSFELVKVARHLSVNAWWTICCTSMSNWPGE